MRAEASGTGQVTAQVPDKFWQPSQGPTSRCRARSYRKASGLRNRRELPVLPLQRNEIVSESGIAQIIERARRAANEKSDAARQAGVPCLRRVIYCSHKGIMLPSLRRYQLALEELDRSLERQDNRRNCRRLLEWHMLTSRITS